MPEDVICFAYLLFLKPNDSGDMNLGNIDTIVLYYQPTEMYCDLSLGKFNFQIRYSSDNLYSGL